MKIRSLEYRANGVQLPRLMYRNPPQASVDIRMLRQTLRRSRECRLVALQEKETK